MTGIGDERQLQQVLTDRRIEGLQHIHFGAAHVVLHVDFAFTIGELFDRAHAERPIERFRERLGERQM